MLPGWLASMALDEAADPSQVQPAGVDLRVSEVYRLEEPGVLGVTARAIPRGGQVEGSDGWWFLPPGGYRVRFSDVVHVPSSVVGLCFPRSSLLRMGAALFCAVWDPGYYGRGEALLAVFNPHGIRVERGARIAQLVFLPRSLLAAAIYTGRYRGEGLGEGGE